jgi:uracil-DNA glycosylase
MNLYDYIRKNIPEGWEELFRIADPEIKQISDLLEKEKNKGYRIVPDMENIFRVFNMCKPEDIKVVIFGQDCYHQILSNGKPRALGLSFSVSKEDTIPGSLLNIYKEIKNCYSNSIIPPHGDISGWVEQGVFLLNSSLTCRANEPNSHSKYNLWLPFIDRFIKFLSSVIKTPIFVLWGKEAQKLETLIQKGFRNILMGVHPSGLSANRGFFGCNHFKMINDILKVQNKQEIQWLEQESTLSELYMKYFTETIPDKEIEDFYTHYEKYYIKNEKQSLKEYTISMLIQGFYIQNAYTFSYEEYLKMIKDKFDIEKKGFFTYLQV